MGRGIIGTIQLMATVVLAIPVAMLGADFLLGGRTAVGAGFLLVAALMIGVEEYVTRPTDVPAAVAERAAAAVTGGDDGEDPEEK